MLNQNHGVSLPSLRSQVCADYGIRTDEQLVFQPVGEDGWAYRLGAHWISIRRDYQGHHGSAYEAARELRDSGLDFVVPPLRAIDGSMVRTLYGHPVVVYPFVAAEPILNGPPLTRKECAELLDKIGEVHRSTPIAELPTEDFDLPFAGALRASMDRIEHDEAGPGPFHDATRDLVQRFRPDIERDLADTAALGTRLRTTAGAFGTTHGDVSAANVLRSDDGLLLVDWGGARRGPAERDLFGLLRIAPPGRTAGRGDPELLRFYGDRWRLSEIAEYIVHFAMGHPSGPDSHAMWNRLTTETAAYLPARATGNARPPGETEEV